MTTRKKKIRWKPDYYLYSVLQPKRAELVRDIEDSGKRNRERQSDDYHGLQVRVAYYCEIALKCLVAVLGEQPPNTHNLHTLYLKAVRLYSGNLDRDIQTRIDKLSESVPALKGFHFAEPSKIADTARNYYKKSRYPKAVPPGSWSEPQLAPHHLFAVGEGASALAVELRSSSAAV